MILFTTAGRTWAYDFDTDTWTQMNPATAPPPRSWHTMAYDLDSDRVVLFGGDPDWGDTWAYDYNSDTWTEMTPVTGPEARFYSSMAYEPVSDRIILFGGVTGPFLEEEPFDDTWAYDFDTNTWTELQPPSAPSARGWHAMAYDEVDEVIVLFSGGPTRDDVILDTWLFDPSDDTWQLAP